MSSRDCCEDHRAGIDDTRYLEALDRAVETAEKRLRTANPPAHLGDVLAQAKRVRQEQYESIDGRWFEYVCRLRPGDLETSRRQLAEATVRITQALAE